MLAGHQVKKIEKVHDYIQIVLSDDSVLSIFNNYYFEGDSILPLENVRIESIEQSDSCFCIYIDGGPLIRIGLTESDYNGPEAMVFKRKGEAPIVWN